MFTGGMYQWKCSYDSAELYELCGTYRCDTPWNFAAYYSTSDVKVKNYGLEKKFYDRYDPAELLKELGMTNEAMVEDIRKLL